MVTRGVPGGAGRHTAGGSPHILPLQSHGADQPGLRWSPTPAGRAWQRNGNSCMGLVKAAGQTGPAVRAPSRAVFCCLEELEVSGHNPDEAHVPRTASRMCAFLSSVSTVYWRRLFLIWLCSLFSVLETSRVTFIASPGQVFFLVAMTLDA